MKKVLVICWKDLTLTFRDRAAWILMLAAPFVLTLGLGAVTGAFSSKPSTGLQEIPVVVVNRDSGAIGAYLAETFQSAELENLFEPTVNEDPAAARQAVDDDQAAAAVIIPAGFSASLLPDPATGRTGSAAPVEVYSNPARPISASAVQSVVTQVVYDLEANPVRGQVAIQGLVESGRLQLPEVQAYAQQMSAHLASQSDTGRSIELSVSSGKETQPQQNNYLAYLAPGMAVFFLMYTVTQGGRSLLAERDQGTLPRLLSTPTGSAQVLGGKLLSIFTTGVLQVGVLVLAAGLLFGLDWGEPLPVALLVIAVSAAATGWGILLASLARTPFQVSSAGTALMLFFGLLGGTFIPTSNFSGAVRWLSQLTPNAWAMEGFTRRGAGGGLAEISVPVAALLGMAAALFFAAVLLSRRRWAAGFIK